MDAGFVPPEQLPQTDTANFWNNYRQAGAYFYRRPLWIQQPGAMDLPIDPLAGSDEHADSAECQRQESIPEPDDNAPAGRASLDENWYAILHDLLNLIHANAIHQPRDQSLQLVNHRMRPNVFEIRHRNRRHNAQGAGR